MQITNEWRKTTKSPEAQNCVEVRREPVTDEIEIRNSNRREQGTVFFTPDEFAAFTAGVKDGEFEL